MDFVVLRKTLLAQKLQARKGSCLERVVLGGVAHLEDVVCEGTAQLGAQCSLGPPWKELARQLLCAWG